MNAFGEILALCKAGHRARAADSLEALREDAERHFRAGDFGAAFPLMKDLVTTVRRLGNHLPGQALFAEPLTWCIQTPLRAGIEAMNEGDLARARLLLDHAYILKTDLAETCRALGECCRLQGQSAAAAVHLSEAAQLDLAKAGGPKPGAARWLVIGDSHARVFQYIAAHHLVSDRVALDTRVIVGATARGLNKPRSISHGREQAISAIRGVPRNTPIILFFGAIDTHYLTWRLHETTGATVEDGLGRSVSGYCGLLDWLRDNGFSRVSVAGVHPPTIEAGRATVWGLEALGSSLARRTAHTMEFNRAMAREAGARGFGSLDIADGLIDRETGVVEARFLVHPEEHHLANPVVAPLWIAEMERILDS